ncbi:hypothetical protein QG070_03425 [Kingella kingae]|uniref:hypothetical protein n=1 Tax=Kingella kingae TaxID=504 RepID=UPI002551253D|nr:hypothetical protein [Kingella kingae]MDK4650090.1 hypothetical protein [Kingella kingae]
MKHYRELIEQQLAARQITLEMDLHKANAQEPFIHQVGETLSRLAWNHRLTMDRRLNVVFVVQTGKVAIEHQIAAMEQALCEKFDVYREPDGVWSVESVNDVEGMCRIQLEAA